MCIFTVPLILMKMTLAEEEETGWDRQKYRLLESHRNLGTAKGQISILFSTTVYLFLSQKLKFSHNYKCQNKKAS